MDARYEGLSSREIDVLVLLEEGAGTFEIAHRLGVAPSTARDHLGSIYAKARADSSSSGRDVDLTQLGLTAKQQEVARLLLVGDTNPAIARKLYLRHETVRNHLQSVYRRLGVDNRYEAIALLNQSPRLQATPRRLSHRLIE